MGNFYMESTQINYRRDDKLKTVDQKLQELSETSAIDTDIAPVFKSTNTYQPGDMVYYRNKLYVFNVEHTGAWASADVTATDVTSAMNAALAGKADYADLAGAFNSETAYTAGDLVIYNGIVYRCTNDHTGAWDADDFSATTIAAELNSINSNLTSIKPLHFVFAQNETKTIDLSNYPACAIMFIFRHAYDVGEDGLYIAGSGYTSTGGITAIKDNTDITITKTNDKVFSVSVITGTMLTVLGF